VSSVVPLRPRPRRCEVCRLPRLIPWHGKPYAFGTGWCEDCVAQCCEDWPDDDYSAEHQAAVAQTWKLARRST
jgi:hypothetical protein